MSNNIKEKSKKVQSKESKRKAETIDIVKPNKIEIIDTDSKEGILSQEQFEQRINEYFD